MSREDVELEKAAEAWLQDQLDDENRAVKDQRQKGVSFPYTRGPVIGWLQSVLASHTAMQRELNELRQRTSKAEYEHRRMQNQLAEVQALVGNHRKQVEAFFGRWHSFNARHEQRRTLSAEPIVAAKSGAQIGY